MKLCNEWFNERALILVCHFLHFQYEAGRTMSSAFRVCHGETQGNQEGVVQGQADTDLNEMGVGEALKNVGFAFAFSSDLKTV